MPQARGFFEKLNFIFESTYNTQPTISAGDMVSLPFISNNVGSSENMIDNETIIVGQRWEGEPAFGNISVEGPISVPFDVLNMGYWLKLLLGAPTTTGTGPYVHTFEPSADSPSATIETAFTDINRFHRFNGVKINKMALNFAVDTMLKVDMDMLGGKEAASAGTTLDATPQEETLTLFNARDISVKIGGVTVGIIKEINLNIDNVLADDVYTLSSNGFRYSLPETKLMLSGDAQVLFLDSTYTDMAVNGTETSVEIIATRGTNTLSILLPEVKFPRQPLQRDGHGPIYYPMNFKGYFQDAAEGVPLRVVLTNDKTSYA